MKHKKDPIKILAVADVECDQLSCAGAASRFADIDLIISCGDLQMGYLDYLSSLLNVPMYYVFGNHMYPAGIRRGIHHDLLEGGLNLHATHRIYDKRLLLAGVEGCQRYNRKPKQYSQTEMWEHVFSLVPRLFYNRMRYGRYLDIFVTHAPPWKIHDQEDPAHTGIRAFRWLNKVFRPRWHLHGHIHVYRQDTVTETVYYQTKIMNCYGYRILSIPAFSSDEKEKH